MSEKRRTIVAEVSKTWGTLRSKSKGLLSQRFEHIVAMNEARGYVLRDWRMTSVPTINHGHTVDFTETIVAVFELKRSAR